MGVVAKGEAVKAGAAAQPVSIIGGAAGGGAALLGLIACLLLRKRKPKRRPKPKQSTDDADDALDEAEVQTYGASGAEGDQEADEDPDADANIGTGYMEGANGTDSKRGEEGEGGGDGTGDGIPPRIPGRPDAPPLSASPRMPRDKKGFPQDLLPVSAGAGAEGDSSDANEDGAAMPSDSPRNPSADDPQSRMAHARDKKPFSQNRLAVSKGKPRDEGNEELSPSSDSPQSPSADDFQSRLPRAPREKKGFLPLVTSVLTGSPLSPAEASQTAFTVDNAAFVASRAPDGPQRQSTSRKSQGRQSLESKGAPVTALSIPDQSPDTVKAAAAAPGSSARKPTQSKTQIATIVASPAADTTKTSFRSMTADDFDQKRNTSRKKKELLPWLARLLGPGESAKDADVNARSKPSSDLLRDLATATAKAEKSAPPSLDDVKQPTIDSQFTMANPLRDKQKRPVSQAKQAPALPPVPVVAPAPPAPTPADTPSAAATPEPKPPKTEQRSFRRVNSGASARRLGGTGVIPKGIEATKTVTLREVFVVKGDDAFTNLRMQRLEQRAEDGDVDGDNPAQSDRSKYRFTEKKAIVV
jgi:hypothetical protein